MHAVVPKSGESRLPLLVFTLLLSLLTTAWAQSTGATSEFDLPAFRQLAASNRAEGIRVGREALARGVFANAPRERMRLLWYMGGAAIGEPDAVTLHEVLGHLTAMDRAGVAGAGSLAGFLFGAQQIDAGHNGQGLLTVLEAANAVPEDDPELRTIAAAELCRSYEAAGMPKRGLSHCRNHTRLVQAGGDKVALARAQYLEASALSSAGKPDAAVPLWRASRDGFSAAGLDALAGRAAGGLADALNLANAPAEALPAARQAVAAARASGNPISVSIAQGAEAAALLGLGRLQEAERVIDAALANMHGIDHPPTRRGLLETRKAILTALGAPRERLAAVERELAAVTGNEPAPQQIGEIDALERRHLQREQALRIRELEQDGQRRELAIEAARQRAVELEQRARAQRLYGLLWAGVALVLVIVVVAGALVMRAQRRLAESLREQAYRDSLTRLPNRRALFDGMRELEDNAKGDPADALLMVDIDHFKRVNDTLGHAAGDCVLAEVARVLSECMPAGGTVGRLGGEEFLVIAPGHDRAAALTLAERMRAAVAALRVTLDGQAPLQVTISIGIALQDAQTTYRRQTDWLAAADAALFRAKEEGRNRVMVATEAELESCAGG